MIFLRQSKSERIHFGKLQLNCIFVFGITYTNNVIMIIDISLKLC